MTASVVGPITAGPLAAKQDATIVDKVKAAAAENNPLRTIDDLVRQRARTLRDKIIVSYPVSGIDYVDYSMRQLDIFAYRVATHYQNELPVRKSSSEKPLVVAMLGPSNLEYLVTLLGLIKMGHTILFLSTRISSAAIASLMETTHANAILFDTRYAETAAAAVGSLDNKKDVKLMDMAPRPAFEFSIEDVPADFDSRLDVGLDHEIETHNHVYIIHSSGSTGFPKPIYQIQRAALSNFANNMNMDAFITLPLYHNFGICNTFRAVYSGRSIHMYNAELPLTAIHLESILSTHKFEILYGVPYALKLLAESETGIDQLRQLKIVMYGGSACPDELGDILVNAGVNLIGHYGATEVGQLMTSFRPAGDKYWNYVRETDSLSPYLNWLPRGPNLFECCVLEGWPAKLTSNMSDGSYATKDLFEPHPSIPRAWKYIARLDDTIALVNGEKFSPVPLEGAIRSDSWVAEAVVFGSGRPYIGMLLIPATTVPAEEVVDHLWPIVDAANQRYEAYGRLARHMIRVLPHDAPCPRTDKGSIIRQAFYRDFATEINKAYEEAEQTISTKDAKKMGLDELRIFLRQAVSTTLGNKEMQQETGEHDDADFFSLGMDSLQAIQLRQEILRHVDLAGQRLGSNVAFDHPCIAKLAAHLDSLQHGHTGDGVSIEGEMSALIDKYSKFDSVPVRPRTYVGVTGATGSLGAHVVARLSADPTIERIYCLVRSSDDEHAMNRVRASLIERRVYHALSLRQRQKICAVAFNQTDSYLGLADSVYWDLAGHLRAVIHCAWAVNFNWRLSSFGDCIAGVHNLIALCSHTKATFSFCSSVSSVARAPTATVPETVTELGWAQGMGYAQSKAVAEHLCVRAAQELAVPTRVLRVGQIIADTRFGIWNATEAIPLMLQTACTMGALPQLPETPSWLPVDTVAQAALDITLEHSTSSPDSLVVNIANHQTFDWTAELLPALRAAGLSFDEVEPREWVRRLRASNPDPVANPPIKLVDFFASKYDRDLGAFAPSKTYATKIARRLSPALASAPVLDPAVVNKFVARFLGPWTGNPASEPATRRPRIIVIAGPCGSGKSTIGHRLASDLGGTFIEGDGLHSRGAIEKMAKGTALADADRWTWLARVRRRTLEAVDDLGYDIVVVGCSALRRSYRDELRKMKTGREVSNELTFVDLQAPAEVVRDRVAKRQEHYMTEQMVDGQIEAHEPIGEDEEDVLPVDASATPDDILAEILPWVKR